MAIIYSNRNDNGGSHSNVSYNSTSTWVGGVVPTSVDQVYIVGRRTQINQAAFAKWTGTRTITVDSTSNFASSGFFYVATNGGEIAKITYTGTTSTTFTGCEVDESDSFYSWTSDQTIPDNAYVHNPAYIIEINSGETFECNELIIQEGGWIIVNGGTLKVNQGILVRDGRLVGRGNGTIIISRPAGTTSASTIGYLTAENYQISVIDIDGGENRTHAILSTSASFGDGSINITGLTSGSFSLGDEIAIYQLDDYRRRNNGYTGYRDASANFKDMDEGLEVVGVSGSTLYVGLRNGATGTIKSIETLGSQKILDVVPKNIYFNVDDTIVVDNNVYTIDRIEDGDYELYSYDFTNSNTSLSDFFVDDSTHIYSSGWEIESGVGLRNTAGAYRELIHKTFWSREVVVEAELSPLSGYTTGTRGTTGYGILTSYDPSFRWGHRGYDTFKSDYFVIDDANQDLYFAIRSMSNYANNRPDRDTPTLNLVRGPVTYKVDTRKQRTTVYLNGDEFTTEFRRDGNYKGLVGLFVNNNSNFRCRSLKIKVPTQRIYITTNNNITTETEMYQSGIDHSHPIGSKVVKLATINTGTGSHTDLGFAYRGQRGNGEWPVMVQINGTNTTNSSLPYIHNHDMNVDYYLNLGDTTSARSVTLDLTVQRTFTHVSFVPRTNDGGTYSLYNGVAIYGSNDLTNWDTLYGPTNDTKYWERYSYNRMGFYPTGTASYRYVKFETKGQNFSPYYNRYTNIGIHNFSEGYTIEVNNVSDLNIGDKITVMTDNGYSFGIRELPAYYMAVTLGLSDIDGSLQGGWLPECTITNIVGNKLYLDKPVFWGYVEGEDSVKVIKINKNFVITGTIGTTFNDWRWPNVTLNSGTSTPRKYLFYNTRFDYIGSYRYSGSGTGNRGIISATQDYWNHALYDGIVKMMGPDAGVYNGFYLVTGINIVKNSVILSNIYGIYQQGNASYTGPAIINNKIMQSVVGITFSSCKQFLGNYNEIASCDSGIQISGFRVDRLVMPSLPEIRFNTIKGTSNAGLSVYDETLGPRRWARVKLENNKVRGSDDYALVTRAFDAWPHIDSNFFAEHTGARISRYRNEGFISEGDTSSDLSMVGRQNNYGRFGYDLVHGVYHWYERDYSRPDILRVYNPNGDDYFWIMGIELDILEDVEFQVFVEFEYRIPWMGRLQDDANNDGRIRVYDLQNGTLLSEQLGVVPNQAGSGWNKFSYTFNNFTSTEGRAGVFLTRDAQNGYIDIKNSTAYVLTDNPTKIKVVGNTFNIKRVWDQYQEYRDTKKLTNSQQTTTKIKRIKI